MEDWLKWQITPLVKYRQNQTGKENTTYTTAEHDVLDFENKEIKWCACDVCYIDIIEKVLSLWVGKHGLYLYVSISD